MCDNDIIAIIPPMAEVSKIQVKPDELLVVKFDTNKYDILDCRDIFQQISAELPIGTHAIAIPIGIELERTTIEEMIKRLEECKDGILH
jgi:hypothetical protein